MGRDHRLDFGGGRMFVTDAHSNSVPNPDLDETPMCPLNTTLNRCDQSFAARSKQNGSMIGTNSASYAKTYTTSPGRPNRSTITQMPNSPIRQLSASS